MDEPDEPRDGDDLPLPFERIGEHGWVSRAIGILRSYGVPIPSPISASAVSDAEHRLGVRFPSSYRELLTQLGLLDLDGIRFLPPHQVDWLEAFWAKPAFSPSDAESLRHLLGIVEYLESGEFIALDPTTGECLRCRHDPPGFSARLPNVDALVQYGFLSLPSGYYGWPDRRIEQLVDDELQRRFGLLL